MSTKLTWDSHTGIYRRCKRCCERYELSMDELRDGTYSVLCTECFIFVNQSLEKIPDEQVVGDMN